MLTVWGWVKTHYCIPIFGEINIHEKHVFLIMVPRFFRVLAIGILKNIEPMKSNVPDIHVAESSVTGTSYFSFLRIEPLAPMNRWLHWGEPRSEGPFFEFPFVGSVIVFQPRC